MREDWLIACQQRKLRVEEADYQVDGETSLRRVVKMADQQHEQQKAISIANSAASSSTSSLFFNDLVFLLVDQDRRNAQKLAISTAAHGGILLLAKNVLAFDSKGTVDLTDGLFLTDGGERRPGSSLAMFEKGSWKPVRVRSLVVPCVVLVSTRLLLRFSSSFRAALNDQSFALLLFSLTTFLHLAMLFSPTAFGPSNPTRLPSMIITAPPFAWRLSPSTGTMRAARFVRGRIISVSSSHRSCLSICPSLFFPFSHSTVLNIVHSGELAVVSACIRTSPPPTSCFEWCARLAGLHRRQRLVVR